MEIHGMMVQDITKAIGFTTLYFVLFLLAKWCKDICTPYKINDELVKKDNIAIALTMSGYYLATAAIFVGALCGPTQGFKKDILMVGSYSLLGLVFLNISRWFNDKLILRKFCNTEQLVKEKNASVGVVQFGTYLATGIIAAGAISGQGGNFLTSIVFFVLGQISLFIFSCIYEKLSPYNIHQEVQQKNLASGIAFSGHLIALSIIIMNSASGDFMNWGQDLTYFAVANLVAFIFLPIIRFVMDRLVVPGDSLGREIKEDKNVGAGFLEATIAISFAVILTRLI